MTGWLETYQGPAAGVLTSVLWAGTALCFTGAGRRLGATTVNAVRILLAIVWLGTTYRLTSGTWVPPAQTGQVVYLALSGLVGLSLGDLALFAAFVRIGARIPMLVMTTAPILAALFGWLALGEHLSALAAFGMLLTIGGVAWVVAERPVNGPHEPAAHRSAGLLLALIATACQAAGSLLSKSGIGHGWLPRDQHLPPLAASFLRMFFAGVFVLPVAYWVRRSARRGQSASSGLPEQAMKRDVALAVATEATEAGGLALADTPGISGGGQSASTVSDQAAEAAVGHKPSVASAYLLTFIASLIGPYLGVWLSLVAFDHAPLAVAQTTLSLSPVFILPLVIWIEREHVSARAARGALIAVIGTAICATGVQ